MPFMVPQYHHGQFWEITHDGGSTTWYPVEDACESELHEMVEGKYERHEITDDKWGCRLSAPGYLDRTDWSVFDTQQEARDHIQETYDVDWSTGEDLDGR